MRQVRVESSCDARSLHTRPVVPSHQPLVFGLHESISPSLGTDPEPVSGLAGKRRRNADGADCESAETIGADPVDAVVGGAEPVPLRVIDGFGDRSMGRHGADHILCCPWIDGDVTGVSGYGGLGFRRGLGDHVEGVGKGKAGGKGLREGGAGRGLVMVERGRWR